MSDLNKLQNSIELIQLIKKRNRSLEPLEVAEIWYRYYRIHRTYKPPQNRTLRRLNGRIKMKRGTK